MLYRGRWIAKKNSKDGGREKGGRTRCRNDDERNIMFLEGRMGVRSYSPNLSVTKDNKT